MHGLDGHGLVTFHYPFTFMIFLDVMNGWMDGHGLVRCDGWMGGWSCLVTFHCRLIFMTLSDVTHHVVDGWMSEGWMD